MASTASSSSASSSSSSSSSSAAAAAAGDAREAPGLPERSLDLLKQALTVWPDVFVKFNYFEKLLAPVNEQPAIVCTGLAILNVILDYQLHGFVLTNITQLKQAIVPSLTSDNIKVNI